jgi:hypothetical protein
MANVPEEIVVAGTGRVFVAPVGTAFPAFGAEPAAPWLELGYVRPDGFSIELSRTTVKIMAMQSRTPVRTVITEEPISVAFGLQQTGPEQVALGLGGGTWAETATDVYTYTPATVGTVDERAALVEITDGDDVYRFGFPRTLNEEGVTFTLKNDEEVFYPITLSILDPGEGVAVYNIETNADQFAPES